MLVSGLAPRKFALLLLDHDGWHLVLLSHLKLGKAALLLLFGSVLLQLQQKVFAFLVNYDFGCINQAVSGTFAARVAIEDTAIIILLLYGGEALAVWR